MKKILLFLFTLLVAGFAVLALEDFGEETTTKGSFTDINPIGISDNKTSTTDPGPMKSPSILNQLEQVAWKIVEFDWNVTSAIERKLGSPLSKVIRMRSEAEPVLARIIGLLQGGVLSNNLQKRK